jgi:hypothetical protein
MDGQKSTGEQLRRISRQTFSRLRAGRPERACGADLRCCAFSRSARNHSAISGPSAWQSAAGVLRALFWRCMMIYHAPAPVYGGGGAAHQSFYMAPLLFGGREQGREVGARRSRRYARLECRACAHVSGLPCGRGYRRPVNLRQLIGAGERRQQTISSRRFLAHVRMLRTGPSDIAKHCGSS